MVSYTVSVSMALIFAQKLNYEINFNQELLAMGAANIFGSCFSCLPLSASLSRSAIQQSTGGKTQVASLVSCALLTVILLWIGPFFELLPRVSLKWHSKFHIKWINWIFGLFLVRIGRRNCRRIKGNAHANQRIFPVLETQPTGCRCVDGNLSHRDHCVYRHWPISWHNFKSSLYFYSWHETIHLSSWTNPKDWFVFRH